MRKFLGEALLWFLFIMATGFWFGFWQYMGRDTAITLIVHVLK